MNPKVSVIIPTVDRPELQRAIGSVKAQTFKDFELLVEHDTERVGKSVMVNNAIKKAKGEYIVVVDDDNELMPRFLELTLKAIEEESAKEMKWSNSEWHAVTTGRVVRHDVHGAGLGLREGRQRHAPIQRGASGDERG